MKLSKKKSFKDKTNPEFLKDSIWRVFCDEKVMTTKGLVTVKYVERMIFFNHENISITNARTQVHCGC